MMPRRSVRGQSARAQLLAGLLLAVPGSSSAGDSVGAAAGDDGVLVVGIYAAPPYHFEGPDGAPAGPGVDSLRALAAAAGLEAQIRLMPFARVVAALRRGQMDMAVIGEDIERTEGLLLLGWMASTQIAAVARPGLRIGSAAELRGLRVAARRATEYRRFVPGPGNARLTEINDVGSALAMLARGRIDALVASCVVIEHAARERRIPRADLGPILVLGSGEVRGYAAPSLAGTRKLARLSRAFAAFDWPSRQRVATWCRDASGRDAPPAPAPALARNAGAQGSAGRRTSAPTVASAAATGARRRDRAPGAPAFSQRLQHAPRWHSMRPMPRLARQRRPW